MYAISVFNNKGGVGKSTLTLFMADFLATLSVRGRALRVLVMDMDAQGSSAAALLGTDGLERARGSGLGVGRLARDLDLRTAVDTGEFLFKRPRGVPKGRAEPLPEIGVMVSDKASSFAFEVNPLHRLTILRDGLKPELAKRFDVAILDLPGNIDERNLLAVNALIMSDAVVAPVEPSRISINALPDTLEMVRYVRARGAREAPVFLGLVLNRVDKRSQQFQRNLPWIRQMCEQLGVPLFDAVLPNAMALSTATDDRLACDAMRERYGLYYPHVKAVVWEVFRRWRHRQGGEGGEAIGEP
ncbi:MAG: ParA family protein [Magnetococcales bacterium]|nr:ParA family protein [Magnetococcales bacterium]